MGLSFAIPIDLAMNSVAQLKEKGRVTRGRIGVQITEVTKETAESFGLPKTMGALVNSVEKGGPAEKAGVEAGDIIVKVDGREVRSSAELPRIVTMVKPGSKVTLTVWRKGAQRDVAVTVAEMKDEPAATPARRSSPGAEGKGEAEPDGPRPVGSDRRSEEGARSEERRPDRGHLGTGARQRAAGRRHPRRREQAVRRPTRRARSRSTRCCRSSKRAHR